MPRVTYIASKYPRKPKKEVNHLAATLRAYKLAAGMTSAEIGERLGCTAENVRCQIGKPADQWRVGDLKRYCDVLGAPREDVFRDAAR